MSDRKFLIVLAASLLVALAVIAGLPHLRRMQTDPEALWTANLYVTKLKALHALQGPRTYVVGGSSSLFSMDTQTLSNAMGRPVVNMATHAGLGLTYILNRITREMRPGDTIIFTPEYSILEQPETPNQLTLSFVAFYDRAYIGTRPLAERVHFYLGYDAPNTLLQTVKALRGGPFGTRPDIVLDALGNARGNTVAGSVQDKTSFNSGGPPAPVSSDAIMALEKFAGAARTLHVRILAVPPALIHLPSWDTPDYRAFRAGVRTKLRGLGMTVLGDDATGWVPPDGMYDSNFHANDAGRAIYTAKVMALICPELGCARAH